MNIKKMRNYNIKDINGYEGLYKITSDGQVWSEKSQKWLKPRPNKKGYLRVVLWKDNIKKDYHIHRIVVENFIGPIPPDMVVNHKNENPSDNNVENLEICTRRYNSCYGTALKRKSEKLKGRPKSLEHRLKISLAHAGKSGLKGKDNPMFGKKHSPEARAKISKKLKESWKNKLIKDTSL